MSSALKVSTDQRHKTGRMNTQDARTLLQEWETWARPCIIQGSLVEKTVLSHQFQQKGLVTGPDENQADPGSALKLHIRTGTSRTLLLPPKSGSQLALCRIRKLVLQRFDKEGNHAASVKLGGSEKPRSHCDSCQPQNLVVSTVIHTNTMDPLCFPLSSFNCSIFKTLADASDWWNLNSIQNSRCKGVWKIVSFPASAVLEDALDIKPVHGICHKVLYRICVDSQNLTLVCYTLDLQVYF